MRDAFGSSRQQQRTFNTVESSASSAVRKSEPLRILLLEDVTPDADLMELELARAGLCFTLRRVEKRDEFLRNLNEFRPDIVLADYSLPQFTALEALRLMHASGADVPFILVTGSQSEEVAVQCMKEGVDDYILKSSLRRLPSALRNAIEKKEAEQSKQLAIEALKQREEHFRSLIENALDIILVLNLDGSIRYSSPSVKIIGYRPEELASKSLFEIVSPDDSQELAGIFADVLRHSTQTRSAEFLVRHKDGSSRVLDAVCKAIYPHSDQFGIVLNARDVTERKEQESAIEKLATFPRLNPNPVFELSSEGRLVYSNEAAECMAKDLGRLHPSEILPADTVSVVSRCLETGESVSGKETTVGNRILSWSFFPIIPSHAVHCYALDVTEAKRMEAQLRQSQKLESVGQLAAGVAHDFNNLLTLIRGYAGLALDQKPLPEDVYEPLKQISAATEKATQLTRQLLLFSRKQTVELSHLNLNEVIRGMDALLRRIAGEQIALEFHLADHLPAVQGDAGMIEQVLMNLAVNARDAMPKGGQLSVSTSFTEMNSVHARINPEARVGAYVCLRVADTGAGISPEVLPRIFEPFFTTKEAGSGTGLGLATVYGIARQHGGWIEVLSTVSQGTTFRLFLPAAERSGGVLARQSSAAPVRGGTETILVAEDEPELRRLVKSVLEHYGYKVIEASSGLEALKLWENCGESVDLLLTDMIMPGQMTGRQLAEQLLQKKPKLRVVYTSGYSGETLGETSFFVPGVNFLAKPFQPNDMLQLIRIQLDA